MKIRPDGVADCIGPSEGSGPGSSPGEVDQIDEPEGGVEVFQRLIQLLRGIPGQNTRPGTWDRVPADLYGSSRAAREEGEVCSDVTRKPTSEYPAGKEKRRCFMNYEQP